MTVRVHPFPSRTRQLSSLVLTILGWKRPGTIGRRQHKEETVRRSVRFLLRDLQDYSTISAGNCICTGGRYCRMRCAKILCRKTANTGKCLARKVRGISYCIHRSLSGCSEGRISSCGARKRRFLAIARPLSTAAPTLARCTRPRRHSQALPPEQK